MKLMYNEKDEAERILKSGFSDGFKWREVLSVAKYYRHVKGWGDARIKTNLVELCKEKILGFRDVPRMDAIRKIVKESKSDFINTSNDVCITSSEYERIRSIRNYKYQTILLGMLVIAKINNRDSAKISEWKYIRKLISRYITNRDIKGCITFCYNNGYIGEIRKNDLHSILFLNKSKTDNPIIRIRNNEDLFRLGEIYERMCGGKLGFCVICKEEFVRESNFQKYCKVHRTEKILQKHMRYNKKRRNDQQILKT